MSDPTDHLATVRAALDLMLRVWPGSLGVRGYVDETGNDAAAVIDVATGETIATCDNEDRDDHAAPTTIAAVLPLTVERVLRAPAGRRERVDDIVSTPRPTPRKETDR